MHTSTSFRFAGVGASLVLGIACTATQNLGNTASAPSGEDASASRDAAGGGTGGAPVSTDGGTLPVLDAASVAPPPGSFAVEVVGPARQRRDPSAQGYAKPRVHVSIRLRNGQGAPPLPLLRTNIRLRLVSGLLVEPAWHLPDYYGNQAYTTEDWQTPGPYGVSGTALDSGAEIGPWALTFDVNAYTDAPVELLYSDSLGRTVRTPVSFEPCSLSCGTGQNAECTYPLIDPYNCGACGDRVSACTNGQGCEVTNQICGGQCVSYSDRNNCGACGVVCAGNSVCLPAQGLASCCVDPVAALMGNAACL